jgi:60 kDa SS-A/Ro ribonucleoprotein
MARLNLPVVTRGARTHEGAPARHLSPELQLRRSVLACMLWEEQFYEDGVEIAGRIAQLVPKVAAEKVAALAIEARDQMHLRHAPLLLVREMARHASHRTLVADTLAHVIQRADELTEFIAIYWKDGRVPLSKQVKRGLSMAFPKFDEYQLAKYDRGGPVKLRDVLFLSHAKPRDDGQAGVWKKLIWGRLAAPDTWEVALSAAGSARDGRNRRDVWERLLRENKLGALALLRNLRNLRDAGVDNGLVLQSLRSMKVTRVLPFRFLAAARHAPEWEDVLERAMLHSVSEQPKLPGRTALLVDVSGSMDAPLARRSEMHRIDVACGLAVLLREIGEHTSVYSFSDDLVQVSARRGFALRDAIDNSQRHGGTYLGRALEKLHQLGERSPQERYDRVIVITDEQAHDTVPDPKGNGYVINVASYKNGVGYGKWTHIDGWSESVIEYIRMLELSDSKR